MVTDLIAGAVVPGGTLGSSRGVRTEFVVNPVLDSVMGVTGDLFRAIRVASSTTGVTMNVERFGVEYDDVVSSSGRSTVRLESEPVVAVKSVSLQSR